MIPTNFANPTNLPVRTKVARRRGFSNYTVNVTVNDASYEVQSKELNTISEREIEGNVFIDENANPMDPHTLKTNREGFGIITYCCLQTKTHQITALVPAVNPDMFPSLSEILTRFLSFLYKNDECRNIILEGQYHLCHISFNLCLSDT